MVKIRCRTNLDLLPCAEKWPDELPEVPRVGDLIESGHEWVWYRTPGVDETLREHVLSGEITADYSEGPFRSRLELQVVRVVWRAVRQDYDPVWAAELELHLPKGRFETLTTFYEWYGQITGRGKGFFI